MIERVSGSEKMRLIAATGNRGKLEEIAQILSRFPFDIVSMAEAGVTGGIEETGGTFEENALIKARQVWSITEGIVLADDSGLEVDCLGGAPGVYSARYAGVGASDEDKNRKLLEALEGVPINERAARFVCAAAVILPDGRELVARGTCEGLIALKPEGSNGFGYDPLFYVPAFGMTIAQMDDETKNSISHRGYALRKLADMLKHYWLGQLRHGPQKQGLPHMSEP